MLTVREGHCWAEACTTGARQGDGDEIYFGSDLSMLPPDVRRLYFVVG